MADIAAKMNKKELEDLKYNSEHPALKNLYNEVVSGKFKWERWGLMSVLGDYVLHYTPGDILEIGCGESSIHLSKLAEKYNRQCYHVEYSKSGVENMKNTKGYFGKNSQVFNMKSDEFFNALWSAEIGNPNIALAFIDGDHNYEVAQRDFFNTEELLVDNGMIILHDTYPPDESWTTENKCGTVYKLRQEIEKFSDFEIFTFKRSAFNVGLSIVQKRK